jgi:hypothetical protein
MDCLHCLVRCREIFPNQNKRIYACHRVRVHSNTFLFPIVLYTMGVSGNLANSSLFRIWSQASPSLCNTMQSAHVWLGSLSYLVFLSSCLAGCTTG